MRFVFCKAIRRPSARISLSSGPAWQRTAAKCSNFRIRLAIVGDFSEYTSKSLEDFIYESNKGNLVYFTNDLDSASEVLV